MKQYHFKMNCGDSVMNGVKVSAKANSETGARIKVAEAILTATRDLKLESLELLGTGRMSAAQLMGAAGGKKSKRVITPEDQRKMQEARKRDSSPNAEAHAPKTQPDTKP